MSEHAWELSKENVQPLRGGRDVRKLNAALCAAPASRDGEIATFEAEIAAATDGRGPHAGDPLVAWTRYVEWLRESHPSGSPRVVLTLERAVHTFKSTTRYLEDPRYVRLWVLYAASREDQLEVFSYMRSNRIGARSALFYEGWANTLERAHMFDKARAAYELGQERDAQPAARLKARFDGFEARMAARKRRDAARARKAAAKAAAGKTRSRPARQALGAIGAGSAAPSASVRAPPATAARPPARVRLGGSDDPIAQRRTLPPVTSDGSFEVFVDADQPPLTAEHILDGAEGEEIPFPSLVRAKIGTRENRMDPQQWRGAKIKQDKKLVRQIQSRKGPVPEFEVYCDPPKAEEDTVSEEKNKPSPVQELLEAFRDTVPDVEEEEAVVEQDLRNAVPSSTVQSEPQQSPEVYQDKKCENERTSDNFEVFRDEEQSSGGSFEVFQDGNHDVSKPTVSALSPIPELIEVHRKKATPNHRAEEAVEVYRNGKPEIRNAPESEKFKLYQDNNKTESFQVFEDKKPRSEGESSQVFQERNVQGNKPKPLSAIPPSSDVFQDRSTGLTPQFEALTINLVDNENGIRDEAREPVPPKSQKKSIIPDLLEIFKSAPQEELSDREDNFDEDQEHFEVYQDQKPSDDFEVYEAPPAAANPVEESFKVFEDAPATGPQDSFEVYQDGPVKENRPVKRDPDAENISPLHGRSASENKKKKGILKAVDQENIPRCDVPSPPPSPAPMRRNPSYVGGVSPTINTKIAARNIENMFNSPLPQEEEEDEFTLMRSLPKPAEESFEVYRDPAHATPGKSNAPVDDAPFEVYRDQAPVAPVEQSFEVYKDPAPGASIVPQHEPFKVLPDPVQASSVDGDDEFVIRSDGNGSSFSVFNELLASMNKENGSDDEMEASDESQRRLTMDEVLTPIPELEGVAPPENLVAVPVSFGNISKSPEQVSSTVQEKSSLLSDLQEWCELERNYYVLDNALAVVKEGHVLALDAGHGDIRKISVDGAQIKGYRGTAEVFVASALNPSNDLAGFGPIKNKDGVVALKVQKNSAWEFYIYKTLHERLNRCVADIPVAMAVFDDQCISRSVMLLNCVSDGSMTEILRMTPSNCFSESVALFFTVAFLRAVEAVHECGIVHTDVTLDNLLLRNEDRPLTSPRYSEKGKDGWDEIGVFLIDFNMAFDTRHSSVPDASPAKIAEMTAKRGMQHVNPAYRKSESSLWAFDADCHAVTICAAKMLGLKGRDVTSYVRLLRHERIWDTFFREMSALSHLSTPSDTIAVMRRNRTTMESILVKDFTLKSSLTKVIMHIAEAKYAADVTKTMGL